MIGIEQVLVSGGDARLSVDAGTGLNRFGCTPLPCSCALSFSSCTTTTISPRSFRRVQRDYESLRASPAPELDLEAGMEALRGELKGLLGLTGTGTEIVFSPSGTDSTLHALSLVRALIGNTALDCILPVSDETGSGVPLALSGRHFGDSTAEAVSVIQGSSIEGLNEGITLISLPKRCKNGGLRPLGCQDQDIWEAVESSVEAGHHVLLQVMDSSKLGTSSPSLECRRRIQRRFAGSVHFVVDACQMRLSRTRLQNYLTDGYLVLISGSKFFTGPPFSGALLVPGSLAERLESLPLAAAGLRDYTSRWAWPVSWTRLRAALPARTSFGQYFRWTAAIEEMQAYFAVPLDFRGRVLHEFSEMAATLIQSHAPECLLEDQTEQTLLSDDNSEFNTRTIFPFLVSHGSRWMPYADTIALYKALNQDMTAHIPSEIAAKICHVGQPVRIPLAEGKDAGALRICADARMVSQLWSQHQANPNAFSLVQQQQEICTILAKTALVAQHLSRF
ncbi:MAG: hypothetical protein ACRYFS_21595 [Janthinobacterium lividum]